MDRNIFDLNGRTALVTGSSKGLGLHLAEALASHGASVIINGRNEKAVEQTVGQFRKKGYKVYGCPFDVTDPEAVGEAVTHIETRIGPLDILVNNAGIQIRGNLENFSLDDWKSIIDVNLTGVFIVTKAAVKGMIERERGKIINICSMQSELGRNTIAPYAASKGGLKMLTRAMCVEWAKYNIQVNGIGPGYFKTEMTRKLWENPEFDSWLKNRTPANRWGLPEELDGALIFLASDASSFVNGQIIYVDGGILAAI
jgi:gluconate 5-dehydrogenase